MLRSNVKDRSHMLAVFGSYTLLTILGFVFAFPIVFMIVSSLKPDLQLLRDTASFNAFLPVGDISFNNYSAMLERVPVIQFLFNSVLVTTITVLAGLVINSMAAYSFALLRWRGRNSLLSLIVATFIIPFETIAIPLLMIVSTLPMIGAEGLQRGWLNTHHVQIIPFLASGFQIFLFYQFFKDLPAELMEAARIDGANAFQIYLRVIVPVSGPVFATAAILRFLDMWNQYLWPLMVVQSETYRPVMVGLQYFFQLDIAWGEIMAYLSTITIPVLILYLALQRAFIESIASTGIKG
ncbi:MAG: carbohydrate ABC transporter permease [Chloroflexi bacterium]|nr:carbohydrate ABC transporter permease [Chloroflexota bacterium]